VADYGVDVDHDFTPYYVTIPGKEKVIRELKSKLRTPTSCSSRR